MFILKVKENLQISQIPSEKWANEKMTRVDMAEIYVSPNKDMSQNERERETQSA